MTDRLVRFLRGRAARRIQRLAMKGRPLQLRFAMWVASHVFRRVWRRLDPAEQSRFRGLLLTLARRRRLEPDERAELQRLTAKLRGGRRARAAAEPATA